MLTDIDLSEYENPYLYDLENTLGEEKVFFLDLVEEAGGPVLDVACGTGQLACEIAGLDVDVTGIDLSARMLEHARDLVGDLPIEFLRADCREFHLDQWFSLAIMTGHAFQNMISTRDQEALFSCIVAHLMPGGYFAFESRNPLASPLASSCSRTFYRKLTSPAEGPIICSIERDYDVEEAVLTYRIWRESVETGVERVSGGRLKFSSDTEIRRKLADAGFLIHAVYGDWRRGPVTAASQELIYLCQKPPHIL